MELDPVRHHALDVVERVRPVEVARYLGALPGVELMEDLGGRAPQLLAQRLEVAPRRASLGVAFELFDAAPQTFDRLVEGGGLT